MNNTNSGYTRTYPAALTLCLGLWLSFLPFLSNAETHTVTLLADDGSDGTLRKEIAGAVDDDVIVFAEDLDGGIIRLSGTEIQITKDLTIDASMLDNGITISGDQTGDGLSNDDSRVFSTRNGPVVTMKSLTITGGNGVGDFGNAGGGLYLDVGTLVMENCIVTGNTSAASGGGIYSIGTLTMRHCTISQNQAGDSADGDGGSGGGIGSFSGDITLEQCTISNNQAGDTTSAMSTHNGGSGGGIRGSNTTYILRQCTVANNQAGSSTNGDGGDGGGISTGGRVLTLEQCTFANNQAGNGGGNGGDGGGVHSFKVGVSRDLFFTDCLIAGNLAGTGTSDGDGPDFNLDALLTISGINLIGDNTLANGNPSTVLPAGDFVGDAATPLDPLLGPLADNGGPTQTILPMAGSPAIDPAGGPGTSAFPGDQRGFERIVGGILDIGATEFGARSPEAIAAARAARRASISRQIRKFNRKHRLARRKKQVSKSKRFKKKLKKLKRQLRAV